MPTPTPGPTISVDALTRSVTGVLGAVGVPPDDAELIAASLVEADRRGTGSHAVSCASPSTSRRCAVAGSCRSRRCGGSANTATNGLAPTRRAGSGRWAMARAVDKPRELTARHFTAVVAVHGSSHYGASARTGRTSGPATAWSHRRRLLDDRRLGHPVWRRLEVLGYAPPDDLLPARAPTSRSCSTWPPVRSPTGGSSRRAGEGRSTRGGSAVDGAGTPTTDADAALARRRQPCSAATRGRGSPSCSSCSPGRSRVDPHVGGLRRHVCRPRAARRAA